MNKMKRARKIIVVNTLLCLGLVINITTICLAIFAPYPFNFGFARGGSMQIFVPILLFIGGVGVSYKITYTAKSPTVAYVGAVAISILLLFVELAFTFLCAWGMISKLA